MIDYRTKIKAIRKAYNRFIDVAAPLSSMLLLGIAVYSLVVDEPLEAILFTVLSLVGQGQFYYSELSKKIERKRGE